MTARTGALVALLVLGAGLLALIVLTTPWRAFDQAVPGGPVPVHVAGDFTAGEVARADRYRSTVHLPAYLSLGIGLLTALVLGLTPLGARLVGAVAAPVGGAWWAKVLLGGIAVTLVTRAVTLPFAAWAESVSRDYGLSTRTWGAWAVDLLKGWALSTGLLLLVLLALFALVRRAPQGWWLPAAAAGALLVLGVSFAYPLVVEPVFNKFTPLAQGELRRDLLALADRDGVPVSDVLVADASRRTTSVNAYVSGYGATRRLVVYDTLLDQASEEEVEVIVAHELGHAEAHDVLHGTLIGALGLAAGVCLLYLVLQWSPLLRRAGVAELADPRSLALVLALVAVLTTLSGPVQLLVSRRIETRADVHALELTREPEVFARMQRGLALANLSDLTPAPLVYALFASHPTAPMRIALARDWARIAGVPAPPPLLAAL